MRLGSLLQAYLYTIARFSPKVQSLQCTAGNGNDLLLRVVLIR